MSNQTLQQNQHPTPTMTKTVTLGEICKITSGGTPNTKNREYFDGGNIPWVKTGDLKSKNLYAVDEYVTELGVKNSSAKLFPKDTVLLAMYGATIGACSILKIPATTNQACAAILPNDKIVPDFLYYYLIKSKKELINSGVGGAQPNISGQIIKSFPIPLPSLDEQRRIAALLDRADALRQKDRQLLAHYDQLAQSIFLDLFGDPVRNEKGWEQVLLGDVVEVIGKLIDPTKEPYSSMLHVGGDNIESNSGELSGMKTAKDLGLQSGKFVFDATCVLYNKIRPYLNKVAKPNFSGICSADMYPLTPLPHKANRDFIWSILNSADFVSFASNVSRRANIPKINREELASYEMILPPLSLQTNFAGLIEHIEKQKAVVRQQMAASEALFGRLLQESFG
ncbi:restriction endonuclease subunit S [Fibrisoma montanum]|nr:restriction endonuclease subunit S [Fibrisoma montanum]